MPIFFGRLFKGLPSSFTQSRNPRTAQPVTSGGASEVQLARRSSTSGACLALVRVSSGDGHVQNADIPDCLLGRFASASAAPVTAAITAETLPQPQPHNCEQIAAAIKEAWATMPDTPQRATVFNRLTAALTGKAREIVLLPACNRRDQYIRYNWIAQQLPSTCRERFMKQLIDLLPVLPISEREQIYFNVLIPKTRTAIANRDGLLTSMLHAIAHLPAEHREKAWHECRKRLASAYGAGFQRAKIALVEAIAVLPASRRNSKFHTLVPLVLKLQCEEQPAMILAMNCLVDALPAAAQRAEAVEQIRLLIQGLAAQHPFAEMNQITHTMIRHIPAEHDRNQVRKLKAVLKNGVQGADTAPATALPGVAAPVAASLIGSLQQLLHLARSGGSAQTSSVLLAMVVEIPTLLQKGVLKQSVMLISRELNLTAESMRIDILLTLRGTLETLQSNLHHKMKQNLVNTEVAQAHEQVTDALAVVPRRPG